MVLKKVLYGLRIIMTNVENEIFYKQSNSTISFTKSSKLYLGFQPNSFLAFVESPNNSSTSAGLKYLSETNINSLPLLPS